MKQQKQKNNSKKGEAKSSPLTLERKCIGCGEIFERKNLIRLMVENQTKEIIINPDNKTFGRSAYICKNENCFKIAFKKNRFDRALKAKPSENFLEKLKIMLN